MLSSRFHFSGLLRPSSLLVLLPVLALISWAPFIIDRPFCHTDEYLTGERSREMSLTGNYVTVHQNFEPNFNKPPLYYAVTSLWARHFPGHYWAHRLLSLVYSVGCLWLCFLIVRRLNPGSYWVAALAVILPLINNAYLFSGSLALLDTGLAFYLLLGCYSFMLPPSMKQSICLFCAIFLGAMHKIPLTLALIPMIMIADHLLRSSAPLIRKQQLLIVGAALLLPLLWVVYHWAHYGFRFIDSLFIKQIWARTTDPEFSRNISTDSSAYLKELGANWLYIGWLAVLSSVAHLIFPAWRKNRHEFLFALIFIFSLLALFLMAFKSPRYFVFLVPLGSILICSALAKLFQKRDSLLAGAYLLCFCLMVVNFYSVTTSKRWKKLVDVIPTMKSFSRELLPEETPAAFGSAGTYYSIQLLYEGALDRQLMVNRKFFTVKAGTPLRCIATQKSLEKYSSCLENIQILQETPEAVYFTALRNSEKIPAFTR